MSEPIITVPWYPGLVRHSRQEMPGGALRLIQLIADVAEELRMASGEDIMRAVAELTGCPFETANKAFGVAAELGLIERQPATTYEWGSA